MLEHYQWTEDAQLARVAEEMADVLWYLLRLSDVLGVDLIAATYRKMDVNSEKYPAYLARGNATKYTHLS